MKRGFTLAESLLTLTILGIISAMTIPTLMNSAQSRDNVGRLKKLAAIFTTSTSLIQAEEGPVDGWEWSDNGNIAELYKPKMRILKDCGTGRGCFAENIKSLSGGSLEDIDSSGNYYKVILTDGASVGIKGCAGTCSATEYGLDSASNLVGIFVVDVNGMRAPNQGGKDVFAFGIVKNKGVQPGGAYSYSGCSTRSSNGLNCAALVIKEDKISYW